MDEFSHLTQVFKSNNKYKHMEMIQKFGGTKNKSSKTPKLDSTLS
jgi:hypothetical protein